MLDEVVVMGYGRRTKTMTTASVSIVASERLKGKVSGIHITDGKPSPGISQNDPAYGQLTAGELK
ncbi:hypothetical protein [Dokdonia sp. 4H-3-7-5]|uniref:hypothetical protein n=1 Tax=Dokdonia sp. (strain 4H-3-7-5) TaxID=983548 RepID=UPI00067458E3|nr:hypothetical protein [Dokdonia sp. 4H-3-7-5]